MCNRVNGVRSKLGELKSAEQLRGALARLVSPSSMTRLADAPDRLLEPLAQAKARLREYANELNELANLSHDPRELVLERELATNPFLRADEPSMMARWGGEAPHETFAALRAAKDNF